MIPNKYVVQNIRTGEIELINREEIEDYKVDWEIRSRQSFVWGGVQFAMTAEAAKVRDWDEMAVAWRDGHDCPSDCDMLNCSCEYCPLVQERYKKFKSYPLTKIINIGPNKEELIVIHVGELTRVIQERASHKQFLRILNWIQKKSEEYHTFDMGGMIGLRTRFLFNENNDD